MHRYCVIGAGPAGVQMGQLLLNEQADYVVFERGPRAGTSATLAYMCTVTRTPMHVAYAQLRTMHAHVSRNQAWHD